MYTIWDIKESIYDREVGYFFASLGMGEIAADVDAEFWYPPNMVSIPTRNVDGVFAQCIALDDSQNKKIIGVRDPRMQQWIGLIDSGETVLGAPGPEGDGLNRMFLKNDNISMICQKENDATKPTGIISLDVENGATIAVDKSSLAMDFDNIVSLSNSKAAIQLSEAIVNIVAEQISLGGQAVMLGSSAMMNLSAAIAEILKLHTDTISRMVKTATCGLPGAPLTILPINDYDLLVSTGALPSFASGSVKVGI